ncbi:MAG: molybdopterin-dependent oxidoreductase, partial [Acidimicrobiia bacterium]
MTVSHLDYLTTEPANAAVPLSCLDGRPLPQDRMYMRNSFSMPDPGTVSGSIDVIVPGRSPRTLALGDLAPLPRAGVAMVLECAGNGRSLMTPVPSGVAWGLGGASPVQVSGVRLRDLIGELSDEIVDVVFTGADQGEVRPEGAVNYQFSLDVGLARSPVPLIVTHLDGEPLAHEHGGPVRLVVPGHYAMKSVKWLTRIEAVTEPFLGHFVNRYRYRGDDEFEAGSPVGRIQVRSVIAQPEHGAELPAGKVCVRGSAWSGRGALARVELSTDAGKTWEEASLRPGPD